MNFLNHYSKVLMKDFDNTDKYKNIRSPILIFSGKCDFSSPYYLWEDFKDSIPNAELIVYENAGHNPFMEFPEDFATDLLNWLDS